MDLGDRSRTPSSLERPPRRDGSEMTPNLEEEVDLDQGVSLEMEVDPEVSSGVEVSLGRDQRVICLRKSRQSRRRMSNQRKLLWR